MVRGKFVAIALAVAALWPVCSAAPVEQEIAAKMQTLQSRFAEIALALDDPYSMDVGMYPLPDYFLRHDQSDREQHYEFVVDAFSLKDRNPALAKRMLVEKACFHFDALKALPVAGNVTTESLRMLITEEVFSDPFAPNYYLGYASNQSDYMLISFGPDEDSDILPFTQTSSDYAYAGKLGFIRDPKELVRLGLESVLTTPVLSTATSLKIEPNRVYDPTNGVVSSGDIIFHRRHGDDCLFSFRSEGVLSRSTLVPKPINKPHGEQIRDGTTSR